MRGPNVAGDDRSTFFRVSDFESQHAIPKAKVPLLAWPMLLLAVCAVSSAASVFATMLEVPTLTLSAWRLQLTGLLMLVPAVVQALQVSHDLRRQVFEHAPHLLASGVCLAFHFGLWVLSIQHTSLTHSLLCVSATPVLLAMATFLLRLPISFGEVVGTLIALVGGALLAVGAQQDSQVTLWGDLAALGGSAAIIGYLLIGRKLRKWMPTFTYAAPVTVSAAALLSVGAMALEGANLAAAGKQGLVGWLVSSYLPRILYLALVPGILGHQGLNLLLRWMDPLLISLGLNLEPLLGSVIGYFLGVASAPGAWTYAGGFLIIVATALVSVASSRREAAAAKVVGRRQLMRELSEVGSPDVPLAPSDLEQAGHPASTVPTAAVPQEGLGDEEEAGLLRQAPDHAVPQ